MYGVLIADDEHIERTFLHKILDNTNGRYFVIGEAANGQEAIELIQSLRPDIALLDINMPIINGLEVAKQAKELYPGMIIILNSAYQEFEFAQKAISSGVSAYLIKPAEAPLILSTLDTCIGKYKMKLPSKNTLGFSPEESYPFDISEKIIKGIETYNKPQVFSAIDELLLFFSQKRSACQHYQLFILNNIFSIRQALTKINTPNELLQLFSDHIYLTRINEADSWYEILQYLEEYFTRLKLLLNGYSSLKPDGFQSAIQYIDTNYTHKITLDELAEIAHLSPSYFSRRFHQETGISIRDYIIQKRIHHACSLLQTTDLSVNEISETCGFSNLSYFYNIFKKQNGASPSQWKKIHKEN